MLDGALCRTQNYTKQALTDVLPCPVLATFSCLFCWPPESQHETPHIKSQSICVDMSDATSANPVLECSNLSGSHVIEFRATNQPIHKISPFIRAWKFHFSGQTITGEKEVCGFRPSLLTYQDWIHAAETELCLCELHKWLPCIIFVLGLWIQWGLESKRPNKSYSCVFLAQVHQRGLFALLKFFPCDLSLSMGRKGCCTFGDSHLREGMGGRKDHFPSLV